MKTRLILFGLIALSCLASCRRDGFSTSGKDVIYVRVNDRALTRSDASEAEAASGQEVLFSIPAVLDNGDSIQVTAYLSDMDESAPDTRGAALTTASLGSRLGRFPTTLYKDGAVYLEEWTQVAMADVPVCYDAGVWSLGGLEEDQVYHWPSDGSAVTFCSYAPSNVTTLTDIDWHGGEKLSFSYSLPEPAGAVDGVFSDALNQPDLLFAMDPQSKDSRVVGKKHFADIQFNHALTAVRFIRGRYLDNCTIDAISLKGFYGAGTAEAVLVPGSSTHENKLDFTWTPSGPLKNYTQTFNRVLTDADANQAMSGHDATGASLDPTDDQSYTFMMIPQLLADGATIEIVVGERLHPLSLVLSGADMDARLKDWRTYAGKVITISVSSVGGGGLLDVEIDDQVAANVKTDVVITNTPIGNDAYVRVAIIANWVNAQGAAVYPYPIDIIASDSHCEGFDSANWVFNDGFYYYKHKLESGAPSQKMFSKFTAPVSGDAGYPADVPNVDHLQMTILVQGVDAGRISDMITYYGWPNVFVD